MEALKERMSKGTTAVRRSSFTKNSFILVPVPQPKGVVLCKPFVSPVKLPKMFPDMLHAMPIPPAAINAATEKAIVNIHITDTSPR